MHLLKIFLVLLGIFIGLGSTMNGSEVLKEHNLTHEKRDGSFQGSLQKLIHKIKGRGDLPYISVEQQLDLLSALSEFDLGRFLIERGGLNGFWIHYAISHPMKGRLSGVNNQGQPLNKIEKYLLDRSPAAVATQQRFVIFKEETQERVVEGCEFASIPCGVMADLLDLDYSHITNFTLHGIDLDEESIEHATALAKEKGLLEQCRFSCQDAWDLKDTNRFDLITSNGLNIYEPDDEKVIELYRKFFSALKSGGCLITSFLTPPPIPGTITEWDVSKLDPKDVLLQKIIFTDILDGKWQAFRSEEKVVGQLRQAGFEEIEVIYDEAHVFPTIIAKKM